MFLKYIASSILSIMFLCFATYASTYSVTPTKVELKGKEIATIKVQNNDDKEKLIQLELKKIINDKQITNNMKASSDILIIPSMIHLKPNETTMVRLAYRGGVNSETELSYRLLLRQLELNRKTNFTGLKINLNVDIPVFVIPGAPFKEKRELSCNIDFAKDNIARVALENKGNVNVIVNEVQIKDTNSQIISSEKRTKRILAGDKHIWELTLNKKLNKNSKVFVLFNGQEKSFDIKT